MTDSSKTGASPFSFKPYQEKKGEEYMNSAQLQHFETILKNWKGELMHEVDRTVHHMQDDASNFPDPNDRASQESEFSLELRTRDRERRLIKKLMNRLKKSNPGIMVFVNLAALKSVYADWKLDLLRPCVSTAKHSMKFAKNKWVNSD